MNRDEKRTRAIALGPAIVERDGCSALSPREPNGGTWISVNQAGVCLALINWHRIEREPTNKIVSRGQIVSELAGKTAGDDIATGLAMMPLREMRPFRLIAIIPSQKNVIEWRWNLRSLSEGKCTWAPQHWFSSGFDERRAESVRRRVCEETKTDGIEQIRHLHRSHLPECGPFSICMHRPDAATVSYTEVTVEGESVTMRCKPGSPCCDSPIVAMVL